MDLINRIAHTRFLGREFLTWLWHASETREGLLPVGDRTIEVWFDAKLTLEALGDIKEQNVIKSESPTETDEARASLQAGKQVKEARLRIVHEQKQWTTSIKADDLSLQSVRIPAVLSQEEDDQIFERFYLLEELEDLIDGLFSSFLEVRLNDETWRDTVRELRTWVGTE